MPDIVLIGGPNGAGKSTIALRVLPAIECYEFVNADLIAAGLSPFRPAAHAVTAGKLMLQSMDAALKAGRTFAFESTLAGKKHAEFLSSAKALGYRVHLFFVWLRSVELAIQRVQARVQSGGHDIPTETIRRRYGAGLRNLFKIYIPLADSYLIYDNSAREPALVAESGSIYDGQLWKSMITLAQES